MDDIFKQFGFEEGPNEKLYLEEYRNADRHRYSDEAAASLAEDVRIYEEENAPPPPQNPDNRPLPERLKETREEREFFNNHPGRTRVGKSKMIPTREEDEWWAGEAAEAAEDAVADARRQGRPPHEIEAIRDRYAEKGDPDRRMRLAAEKAQTAGLEQKYEQLLEAIPYAKALSEQQQWQASQAPASVPAGPGPATNEVMAGLAAQQQQAAMQQVEAGIAASEHVARQHLRDYDQALGWLKVQANMRLIGRGITDPVKRDEIIRRESMTAVLAAINRGQNPAAFMYSAAVGAGYRPT